MLHFDEISDQQFQVKVSKFRLKFTVNTGCVMNLVELQRCVGDGQIETGQLFSGGGMFAVILHTYFTISLVNFFISNPVMWLKQFL